LDAVNAAETLGYPVTLSCPLRMSCTSQPLGREALCEGQRGGQLGSRGNARGGGPKRPSRRRGVVPSVAMAFVGGHRDPEFGAIVVTGLGGATRRPTATSPTFAVRPPRRT
jgi:hypothetical protein